MKRLTFIAFLFFIIGISSAQDSSFTIEHKPYVEIDDGTSINDSTIWRQFNQRFYIPIGFTYEFLGEKFDSVYIETSGRLVFDDSHLFFADAFVEISFQDVGYKEGQSLSPISYKHEIENSSKVLIIQFKNVGFAKDSLSRVNYQIRLYERSNEFELHMGPSKINDHSLSFINGPYSALYKIAGFEPITLDYRLGVYDNPEKPDVISDSGKEIDLFGYKLSETPKEGTVYRFKTILPPGKK